MGGEHVQNISGITPRSYDCFNTTKPDFNTEFFPVCLGLSTFMDSKGRQFDTLSSLLKGSATGSVLLKLDIEGAECDILTTLTESDFLKIRSMFVEFHVRTDDGWQYEKVFRAMKHLQKHFIVVQSYYGVNWGRTIELETPERINGFAPPDTLYVNYISANALDCK